ncbi:HDOD domain-containing protein [Thiohalobacter sp. IOR34]|uniref:HDOD domain-containing protein n=1 Tax=Thiohalobacter sp. IOR34 TaxID=3057176 RepID=UPI0025B1E251|nr:HDOD domain-containing protein [Thiohalobacter sp. IOR34]WJW75329.1 HDOD domain-containing protein [Thiohalobacter sp. IOR34]
MPIDIENLVTDTLELASLPEVVMRAVDLINDPDSSAAEIGDVIAEDPALTARLLKIVNSPFYGFPSRIDTVSRAITVVGTLELLDLILATSVIKVFSGIPPELIDMDAYWEHNLYTAVTARVLARRHRAPDAERYFIAALLHDIGALVLYRQLPDESTEALRRVRDNGEVLHCVEREILGFDHGEVGAELLRNWRLPEAFIEAARYHHFPLEAGRYPLETALVHLADVITSAVHAPDGEAGQVPPMEPRAWELVGLPVESMEAVVNEADVQFAEARAVILPGSRAA